MSNDQSCKSRKKKKKPKKDAATDITPPATAPAADPPKFTSKAVESDDHYVVFQFEPVAPETPSPVTPSPISAPSPNDYEHMLPKSLPVPAETPAAVKSIAAPEPTVEKSSAMPGSGKKSPKWEAGNTSQKKKKKSKKEPTPPEAPADPPKFTSKAVESDDHYVVFQFEPAAPATPSPVTPSPISAPSPNDYEHMLPKSLPVPAEASVPTVEKSSAVPLSNKKHLKSSESNTNSTKSRKRKKGKKTASDMSQSTPPFESNQNKSKEANSTKSRKKTRKKSQKKPGDKK